MLAHDETRTRFEAAVVERLKESGFLEIEIRTECLARVDDGYQDEVINAGWHYWQAGMANGRNQHGGALREAAANVIATASDTYKKRNGHVGSFEDESGEKCWIVPFDAFEALRSAVDIENCPVCDQPLEPDDICANDIELGICHAECLKDSPVVDLDTGEETGGEISNFRYGAVK